MKKNFFTGFMTLVVLSIAMMSGLFVAMEQGPPGVVFQDMLPSMVREHFLVLLFLAWLLTCVAATLSPTVIAHYLMSKIQTTRLCRSFVLSLTVVFYALIFRIQESFKRLVMQSQYSTSRSSFFKAV